MRRQATGHARQLARSRKRRSAAPDRESQPERDANGEGAKAGDSRRRASALLLLAFAVVFIGLRVGSLTHKSATFDEPIHLTAGYLAAAEGDYRVDPSHPPFVRMWAALPLLVMGGVRADTSQIDRLSDEAWLQDAYRFSSHFLYREHDADRLLQPARFMMVLWGVGLGILLFFWAHEWLGFTPAAIALAFYTIEPNIAAHARLVTTDVGVSFFIFATVYSLWRTCRQPSVRNVTALAVCFALAFVTKFSAFVLVPIVLLLLGVSLRHRLRLGLRASAAVAGLLGVSAFVAIWAVYGFRYAPSASDGWLLRLENAPIVLQNAPTLGKAVAWIDDRHVLPNAFTQGFLMSQASARQMSYLGGEYSDDGWWYYFPVAFLLKTPAALTLLLLSGGILLFVRRRQLGLADTSFVVLPVVVYMAVAMASGINIGLRHILPIYPFVLLIAALAAKELMSWRRPAGRIVLATLTASWCVTFVYVYPHMLTFFTVLTGGPGNGLAYLTDSNLDWGQDLKLLKEWMQKENVEHINLAYFGTADPEYYGIAGTYLPGTDFVGKVAKPELPGYVAISATLLSGVYLEPHWRLFYDGFVDAPAVARIGNSIYVFEVQRWPEPRSAEHDRDAGLQKALGDALYLGMGWGEHAILHYRLALGNAPDDVATLGNLGMALLEAGRAEEAIDAFRRASALEPTNARFRYRLALALMKAGKPAEAAAQADATVRMNPRDAAARDLLGMALASTGRLAAAEASFEKALELMPGFADAQEHLRRLREVAGIHRSLNRSATPSSIAGDTPSQQ
ncbi:MAG TPA: tetratricopeptide repeat protein [Vicinamibacterales bacterium]|nr:tetratricopeptide repeat protein [Vicinamibacterales bacterium]